jgi:ribosome-associated toxin RatA of RatAB toxin-antitoxin module
MREIRRSALVPVPAQRMFALINDIDSYPQFVPGCQAASVLERTHGDAAATYRHSRLEEALKDLERRLPPAA